MKTLTVKTVLPGASHLTLGCIAIGGLPKQNESKHCRLSDCRTCSP